MEVYIINELAENLYCSSPSAKLRTRTTSDKVLILFDPALAGENYQTSHFVESSFDFAQD